MTAPRTLTRGEARLLAFTAGATCANLYYAQPLLPTIAASLHVSQTSASLLVTLTQLSYGVGLLLLVPAADITRRRTLFTWLLGIDTVAVRKRAHLASTSWRSASSRSRARLARCCPRSAAGTSTPALGSAGPPPESCRACCSPPTG
jgi:MFS family permease